MSNIINKLNIARHKAVGFFDRLFDRFAGSEDNRESVGIASFFGALIGTVLGGLAIGITHNVVERDAIDNFLGGEFNASSKAIALHTPKSCGAGSYYLVLHGNTQDLSDGIEVMRRGNKGTYARALSYEDQTEAILKVSACYQELIGELKSDEVHSMDNIYFEPFEIRNDGKISYDVIELSAPVIAQQVDGDAFVGRAVRKDGGFKHLENILAQVKDIDSSALSAKDDYLPVIQQLSADWENVMNAKDSVSKYDFVDSDGQPHEQTYERIGEDNRFEYHNVGLSTWFHTALTLTIAGGLVGGFSNSNSSSCRRREEIRQGKINNIKKGRSVTF